MSNMMDPQVSKYIDRQESPQKEILHEVRRVFQENLPNCEEKMRWGVPTYAAGKFYIAAMKTRVHVGFAITGLTKDEISLFEGSGKTMRHIKIPTLKDVDEKKLVNLIKMVDKKATCQPC
jgi:uncharacterized protein YdhG (YjbR/CyaY superfamily)